MNKSGIAQGLLALGLLACGSEDRTVVERNKLIPPLPETLPADKEPPVSVVRGFDCTPEAVPPGAVIAELPNGTLKIEPAGPSCIYHLVLDENGQKTRLSSAPGGYLFALGWTSSAGNLAICASNIAHRQVDGALRKITDVSLECAFRVQGLWTELAAVVSPEGAWAAWPRTLGLAAGTTDTLELEFVRDSTFNILNLSDAGRPEEDGLYRMTFRLESDGFVISRPMELTAPSQNPFKSEDWEPTDAEKAELEGVIDFSDGDCPNGCPTEP